MKDMQMKEIENNLDHVFLSNDQINDYLEECYQRDLSKMTNDELEDEHIQYIETKKQKYRSLGDRLFHQALESEG